MLKSDKILYVLFTTAVFAMLLVLVSINSKPAIAPTQEPINRRATTESINYQPSTTTLFFAGDIMLSRNVADKMHKAEDFTLPFKNVMEIISSADISFANLESPFNDQGKHFVPNSLVFNADPKSVEGLTTSGFDVVSTANNHSFDQGAVGLEFTRKLLMSHDILPIGTGKDCHSGTIITRGGFKFGFLAYSYAALNDGGKKPDPLVCDWNNEQQIVNDIQKLRASADVIIVSGHMGTEYKQSPDPENAERTRKVIDAGADLFVGHHPHWIQTIEEYKGKWIFYSLGNFVFDQMWSQDTKEGLTVTITYNDNHIKKIELNPVIIENYCCARWATPEESKAILQKIGLTNKVLVDNND